MSQKQNFILTDQDKEMIIDQIKLCERHSLDESMNTLQRDYIETHIYYKSLNGYWEIDIIQIKNELHPDTLKTIAVRYLDCYKIKNYYITHDFTEREIVDNYWR